jgi:mono/diheme cytochrome c family protein/roadblock/LC7 domain-containing protein
MKQLRVARHLLHTLASLCVMWAGLAGHARFLSTASADEPATQPKISYYRDIRPILQQHCQGCHQPAKPMGGLVLTSYEGFKKGGESELAGFVPGKPDDSEILSQITPVDGQAAMPKGQPPLSGEEIAKIKQWIMEGASDDSPMAQREVVDSDHPPVYALPPVITSLDYSPDGQLLAVSGYHEIVLHKADGSGIVARLVGLSERIESAVFSPDGKLLAVTGGAPARFGEVQIWNVAERKLQLSVNVGFDTLYGASWSHDGKKIAFGCADNTVRAINAETGEEILKQGAHTDWVLDTVFSTDSSHLVSVSRDRSMKLTNVETGRFDDNITSITPGALKGGLMAVDRHPAKDELLCGGADGVPKLYRMYRTAARQIGDDFNRLMAYEAMPGRVFDVAFSRDGNLFVAGCSYQDLQKGVRRGEVRIYKTAEPAAALKFAQDHGAVYAVAFQPDGKIVAAGGFQGQVRLYDATTGALIRAFDPVPITPAVAAQ